MDDDQVHPARRRFAAWVAWLRAKHAEETGEHKKLSTAKVAEKLGVSQVLVSQLLDDNGTKFAGLAAAVRIEECTADWPEGPIVAKEWVAGRSTLRVKTMSDGVPDATGSAEEEEAAEEREPRTPIAEGAAR